MAIIIDPDNLSQGTVTSPTDAAWGTPTGATVTITSAGTELPSISAGDYFEVRDHSSPENNGLYLESGGSPTTGSITADKITGPNPSSASGEAIRTLHTDATASDEKSVHIDVDAREIHLLLQGNLTTDGVSKQALYSFLKEEWKDDDDLPQHPFPMISITPEQFELIDNWNYVDDTSRKLVRTGGWRELDTSDVLLREYAGIITLGAFEDLSNDLAYYQVGSDPTDTGASIDFDFAGPVNEPILIYEQNVGPDASTGFDFTDASPDTIDRNDGGSWITDGYLVGGQVTVLNANTTGNNGTYEITAVTASTLTVQAVGGGDAGLTTDTGDNTAVFARNYRNAIKLFLRVRDADPNGKTYAQAALADTGFNIADNKVFRFPLSNATDLKITETDANISSNSPYTEIVIRYFDQSFQHDVDTPGTPRDFGIVIDVGTFSGVDGVSNGTTSFTTAEGGIPASTYDGGDLILHEGTDKGSHTISSASGGTVTLSSALTGSETDLSFSLQRSSPVVATAEEIYEKVQFQLRQAADIDETDQVVTGSTADDLLRFVGDTLEAGQATPNNPNGGGSGVVIIGFDSNDTNRIVFFDNTDTSRTFPFVAAGSINFNSNLENDTGAQYWMFFEYSTRTTVSDLAISSASGATASIDSAGSNLPSLSQDDYIRISGATNTENNGIWIVTDATPTTAQFDARKVDGVTVVDESAFSATVDENPVDSPTAIIVDNNAGADIAGSVPGSSASFDFDYDGNTQGGRTAGTDADIILRALGLETAQFVEATGTITRSTGLSFTLVAPLERNYDNP